MVEFGAQIQGVQGDEPGEAVMLDSSGQIPSSGSGGLKWTRVALGTALTAGRVYKIIGPYGSSEFVKNTGKNIVYFPYFVEVRTSTGSRNEYGCRAEVGVSGNIEYGTVDYSGTGSSDWSTVQSTDANTALYILED